MLADTKHNSDYRRVSLYLPVTLIDLIDQLSGGRDRSKYIGDILLTFLEAAAKMKAKT